jgi:Tol biopolymer transport system component
LYFHRAQIYTIGTDGSRRRRLMNDCALLSLPRARHGCLIQRSPSFSPGGQRIVLTGDRSIPPNDERRGHIYVVRADGSHLRKITDGQTDIDPSWAPAPRR